MIVKRAKSSDAYNTVTEKILTVINAQFSSSCSTAVWTRLFAGGIRASPRTTAYEAKCLALGTRCIGIRTADSDQQVVESLTLSDA